jgi:hypothetical protein
VGNSSPENFQILPNSIEWAINSLVAATPTPYCIDSDNGKNYSTVGYAYMSNDSSNKTNDVCVYASVGTGGTTTLTEAYCENNTIKTIDVIVTNVIKIQMVYSSQPVTIS